MTRDHLEHAADELTGLLEHTTPGPWRLSTPGTDGARYRSLVSDTCTRGCDEWHDRMRNQGPAWARLHPHDGYGGCLVAESCLTGDRDLMAAMRNAADHLPNLLRAVAHEDPIEVGRLARLMAAELCPCDEHVSSRSDTNHPATCHPPVT